MKNSGGRLNTHRPEASCEGGVITMTADSGSKKEDMVGTSGRRWAFQAGLGLTLLLLAMVMIFWFVRRDDWGFLPKDKKSLRLAMPMQPSSALLLIAIEKGLFSVNGLDITVEKYPSGKRALNEGLLSGNADIVSSSDIPVALAGMERSDFKIIAAIFSESNVNCVIARKTAGIESPKDLKGKRIATQHASAVHFFLHRFILYHGLTYKDFHLSFMKAEELPEALSTARIDAFSMREPYISQAKKLLGDNAVLFYAPGIYTQMEIFVVKKSIAMEKPDAVRRLLIALLQAEQLVLEHSEEAARIIADQFDIDGPSANRVLQGIGIFLPQSLVLILEDGARWAKGSGLTGNSSVPNYLEVIDYHALAELKPERVSIFR